MSGPNPTGDAAARDPKPWREVLWRRTSEASLAIHLASLRVIDANDAAERLFGYASTQLAAKGCAELLDERTMRVFRNLGQTIDFEPFSLSGASILNHDGDTRLVELEVAPSIDAAGDRVCLCRLTDTPSSVSEIELQRLNWALAAYARSASALLHSDNFADLVRRFCEAVVERDDYALACVGLAEAPPGAAVNWVAGAGRAVGYMEGLSLSASDTAPEGAGPTGRALRSGVAQIMRDSLVDPAYAPWREKGLRFGIRSSVTVPFRRGERIIGALLVYASRPDAFGAQEMNLFRQLAEELAFAIALDEDRVRLKASEAAQRAAEEAAREAQLELTRVARASTLGEFSASIAHEVSQPLAAIVTNSDASLRWLAKAPAELDEAREAIKRTIRDANRANDVIGRMRSLMVKHEPDVVVLDVNAAIEEVLLFTRGEQRRAQVGVRSQLTAGLPRTLGDRIQLQQVVLNLIMNGLEAMRSVNDRPRILSVRTRTAEAGDILVEVEDSGVGLDPSSADRLFDHLFTTKIGGTGLGLTISRTIVEAHGGRIWATAASPHGAVFHFTLPPATDPAS